MAETLMRRVVVSTLAFGALVCVCILDIRGVAQNAGTQGNRQFDYSELAKVPEKARGRKDPLDGDPIAVLVGRKLFGQHCAECHGPSGEGGKRAPSLRVGEVQQAPPGALFWILTNGVVRRGMPVWSKLPEPQRWQIVAYIKALEAASPPTSTGQTPTTANPR